MPGVSSQLAELTIRADSVEVRRASEWLDAACQRRDVPPATAERLALCLNEVLANIIIHGGSSALSAPIELALEVTGDPGSGTAGVTVSDRGTPFDPLSIPTRVSPKTLEEASVGGLGLVMIRRCSDWLDYRNEDGRNRLVFGIRWNSR